MVGLVTTLRGNSKAGHATIYMRARFVKKELNGFTLVEVLMTIVVVGSLAALFGAAINVSKLIRDLKHRDIALRVAAHEIESQRALGYASTTARTITDTLLDQLPLASASTTITDYNDYIKQITASVAWTDSGQIRTQSITTLITEVGGL